MNRLTSAIARIGLGLMILCATLVGTGTSASAAEEKYVQLAEGSLHSCGLLVSGSVKCWGYNAHGQLGLGYFSESVSSATLVPGLTNVASLVIDGAVSCAVLVSGPVKCWGFNLNGELGLGYVSGEYPSYGVSSPTLVPGLTDVASLVLGRDRTCAVLISGSVNCWGANSLGQLGLGYNSTSAPYGVPSPTLVPGLTDVAYIIMGTFHSCAVLVYGSAKCWGYNFYGQLGLGYNSESVSSPTLVPGVTDVASLVVGGDASCAVLVSGSVKCWGDNSYGQLGLGYTSESVSSPTLVPELTHVVSLVSGNHSWCAVLVSGSVNCWGYNYYGQLGLGYTSYSVYSPALVTELTHVASLVSGGNSWCAVSVSGSVNCWGSNPFGELGLGYTSNYVYSPSLVPELSDFASFVLGGDASCAVLVSGSVKCWGWNYYGQLGLGHRSESIYSPTLVPGVAIQRLLTAPTSVAATSVGATSATVTFVSPVDVTGEDPITAFEYSLDGGTTWVSPDVAMIDSPLTINGLVHATTYSAKIRAVNSQGPGAASEPVALTTLAIPASAPSITSAVTGSGKVTLTIAAPSVLGDTALSGYDYSINNGSTWSHFASVDGPFVITGLTNATDYQVKVRAINSAGAGEASATVTVAPTSLAPSLPTIGSVNAGNQVADVNIAQATGVTAQSITGYQYNINSSLSWANCVMTAQSCRVVGLSNGIKTTVRVRAVNANGVSLASAKSYVTSVTTSQSPTINTLSSSAGALNVAFTAPVDNGGSKVLRYEYSVDGGAWVNPARAITKSPFKVSGLANATSYAVRIRAVTAVGIGEVSTSVSGSTPAVIASAPSITSATVGKTSITVNFNAPANNGGAAVTNYAYTVDGKTWTTLSPTSTSTQIVISGLTSSMSYSVRVRAINGAGAGAMSATQSIKTLK